MNLSIRNAAFTTAALVAFASTSGHAAVYDNSNGTGIWSDGLNWTGSNIADTAGETAQMNAAGIDVDSDFTLGLLQTNFGSAGFTSSGVGTLTLDRNAGGPGAVIANVSGGSATNMIIGSSIVIDNSAGGISWIRNQNNSGNSVTFAPSSSLVINSNIELVQAVGGSIVFNGPVSGGANIRVASNGVTFGPTADLSGHTGELVLFNNANITVDTAAGGSFYAGSKIQTNGTATLTLNEANVVDNQPLLGFAGGNLTMNVNGNQDFGNLNLGSAFMSIVLDDAVTSLDFLPSGAFSWSGGTLNIDNFKPGVIGFGFDGGLTNAQLSQITIDGLAPSSPLFLDGAGLLIPEPASMALFGLGLAMVGRRRR